jgi:hypothetical protein
VPIAMNLVQMKNHGLVTYVSSETSRTWTYFCALSLSQTQRQLECLICRYSVNA